MKLQVCSKSLLCLLSLNLFFVGNALAILPPTDLLIKVGPLTKRKSAAAVKAAVNLRSREELVDMFEISGLPRNQGITTLHIFNTDPKIFQEIRLERPTPMTEALVKSLSQEAKRDRYISGMV